MLVVSLGGSPSQRSRSGVLLDYSKRWLQQQGVEVVSYQVRDFPAEDLRSSSTARWRGGPNRLIRIC